MTKKRMARTIDLSSQSTNEQGPNSSEPVRFRSVLLDGITGERIDTVVARIHQELFGARALSRSQLQMAIERGQVRWRGIAIEKPGERISGGGELVFPEPGEQRLVAESDAGVPILYEDDAVLVISKPAGIAVHPGAGRSAGTLVNKLLMRLPPSSETAGPSPASVRPGVVHRLDKDTSGVMVLAKSVQAHAGLAKQFASHSLQREYEALVVITPRARRLMASTDQGTIDAPLIRRGRDIAIAHSAKERERARRAVTHWRVVERLGYGAIVRFTLETGRTHQIRVHASSVQSPVIGDPVYGDFSALPAELLRLHTSFGRQALHARILGFVHPLSGESLHFEVPPPEDHLRLIEAFRAYGVGGA